MPSQFLVPISLPADPINPLDAATKQYVDGKSSPPEVFAQAAEPGATTTDIIWVDIDDTSSGVAPVEPEVFAQAAEPGTATTDIIWVDIDDTSLEVASATPAVGNNRILNGDFSVNQRGLTSGGSVANDYGFDRWRASYYSGGGAPATHHSIVATPGELPESAEHYFRIYSSGAGPASSARTSFGQPIEDVRTLSGKTVTVSFWAKAGSGTPNVGVLLDQILIAGGSNVVPAGVVVLSTTWKRYSVTVDLPSLAGETLSVGDYLHLSFFVSQGTGGGGYPPAGGIGVQTGTFDFWGVQLEEGSVASAFEQKTYAEQLRACQRYYYRRVAESTSGMFAVGYMATTTIALFYVQFPVPMRSSTPNFASSAAGTLTAYGAILSAITAPAVSISSMGARLDATTSVAGTVGAGTTLIASGSNTAFLEFLAEIYY
jgi:hypothetical protein